MKTPEIPVPPASGREFKEYMVMKKKFGLAERGILALVYN
jgi:hypothetical protein